MAKKQSKRNVPPRRPSHRAARAAPAPALPLPLHTIAEEPQIRRALAAVERSWFATPATAPFSEEDIPFRRKMRALVPKYSAIAALAKAAEMRRAHKVLLVGAESGYLLAVLAQLAKEVYSIERDPRYVTWLKNFFTKKKVPHVHITVSRSAQVWKKKAPFDRIFLAESVEEIPRALLEQLKPGGVLIAPHGPTWANPHLELCTKEKTGAVTCRIIPSPSFIPSPRRPLAQPRTKITREMLADHVREHAIPLCDTEAGAAALPLDEIVERLADARVVFLGESTHGTKEFYEARAAITKALIERAGFTILATEADWPDAFALERYIHGAAPANHTVEVRWKPFARFPQWMWLNEEFVPLIAWMRTRNQNAPARNKVHFYGLDLYALGHAMHEVIRFLAAREPELAREARARYACLAPFQGYPSHYGALILSGAYRRCEQEAVKVLMEMLRRHRALAEENKDEFFNAYHNAENVVDAERYYLAMYYGAAESWNLRDLHMYHTLRSLLSYHGARAKAIVWAHNSHIGNAVATEMAGKGEISLGYLAKEHFGDRAALVGLGTHAGAVLAACEWGGKATRRALLPSSPKSLERLFHAVGGKGSFLSLHPSALPAEVRGDLAAT